MSDRIALQQSNEWMRAMRRGDWEAAWKISDRICEQRRRFAPHDTHRQELPRHLQWVWDGSPLSGKRVLVRCYHGLGDTIQFIRLVQPLRPSVAHITVVAQAPLLPLLETAAGIDTLLELSDSSCDLACDSEIEVMELAHALRITPATLPRTVPYLHPDNKHPLRPNEKLQVHHYTKQSRVGLVWQSGDWDKRRSVPPRLLEKLTRLSGIRFVILQRGPGLAAWPTTVGEIPVIHDILEEAVELKAPDLLICVDTLSAHLAGALGVRTWMLLPAEADWRWMQDRDDTPWYPTMRLFRQTQQGDWETVIARVHHELLREYR